MAQTFLEIFLRAEMFQIAEIILSNLINPRYMKDVLESTSLLFGSERGVFGSSFMHILEYLRPSFHPNDHDTTKYMEYYKERLLNPETGLLSPYFLKEFVPPVRAASA